MPGFVHGGALPPRPPTPEEIEAAQKKKVAAEKKNAERLADVALRNTKKSLKAPAPPPTPPKPQAAPAPKTAQAPKAAPAAKAASAPITPPAPKAAQPAPSPASLNDLPKDEGDEEVFTEEEKSELGEDEDLLGEEMDR